MKLRLGRSTAICAVASAFLMISVLPTGAAAAASPDLTPGAAYTLWAYGGVRSVSFSGPSGPLYDYQGNATYGYSVILNQTNQSAQDFELSANQTMGVLLSVEFCTPNCQHPKATATVVHDAWESVDAWANFTTAATVFESGTAVPATGLLNSHTTVRGSLFDSAQGLVRDELLTVNVSANASVSFATPLGLLPSALTAPSAWNDSANFSSAGSFAIESHYRFVGPKATINVPYNASGSVAGTGNVSVAGAVTTGPGSAVTFGGLPYLNVSLSVQGPFVTREGFILLPANVDLFGASSAAAWSANETGGASAQMTSLYVRPDDSVHLGIGGSEWLYSSSALNPSVTALTTGGAGVDEIASGASDVSSEPVQGVPISVGQAQQYQSCLLTGSTCAAASGPAKMFPVLLLGLVAAVVLAAVLVVAVAERRRIPPPQYPNSQLYPPGTAGSAPPAESPPAPGARRPPTAEDDPLANLW